MNLWTSGQLQNPVGPESTENLQNYGVEGFVGQDDVEEGQRPIFESLSWNALDQDFIRNGQNFGIDYFLQCLNNVRRHI